MHVSCRQLLGLIFKIQSNNICFLMEIFNPFTFNDIIDMVWVEVYQIIIFLNCSVYYLFVPLSLLSCLIFE